MWKSPVTITITLSGDYAEGHNRDALVALGMLMARFADLIDTPEFAKGYEMHVRTATGYVMNGTAKATYALCLTDVLGTAGENNEPSSSQSGDSPSGH